MFRTLSRILFFSGLSSLLLTIALSSEIAAQSSWPEYPPIHDFGGAWTFRQFERGEIKVEIQQNGKEITGKAYDEVGRISGTVQGRVWSGQSGWNIGTIRDFFEVEIAWQNGAVGVYHAVFFECENCDFGGDNWQKGIPDKKVKWFTSHAFPKIPPPKPKPIKSSGKARPTAPPKFEPPFITAGQPIFAAPGVPTGLVVLTWEAGPEYPGAEVWLKTPNGAQTFLKQTKGGVPVTVERGRYYEYALMDAGRILAGVGFYVPPY